MFGSVCEDDDGGHLRVCRREQAGQIGRDPARRRHARAAGEKGLLQVFRQSWRSRRDGTNTANTRRGNIAHQIC
jgi:hypothetical protein